MRIALTQIIPNPDNPRRVFDETEIRSLAESIRQHGLINAISVEDAGERYILIDGERRWRAAKIAGLTEIEATVKPAMNGKGKQVRLMMALAANIQRQDMTPVDEARAYQIMLDMGMSQAAIAHAVSVSQPRVASRLSLIKLDDEILDLVNAGLIPIDARVSGALLSIPDKEARVKLATKLARPGMTVKGLLTACEKYNQAVNAAKTTTAAQIVKYRQRSDWGALQQLGRVPPWGLVVQAVEKACDKCGLADMASVKVCGACPLVMAVENMLEK